MNWFERGAASVQVGCIPGLNEAAVEGSEGLTGGVGFWRRALCGKFCGAEASDLLGAGSFLDEHHRIDPAPVSARDVWRVRALCRELRGTQMQPADRTQRIAAVSAFDERKNWRWFGAHGGRLG